MNSVVIVESPSKAKTINKYLGSDYTVLASYGHVRDLPSKDGSVKPDNDFLMNWEVDGKAKKHVKDIANALKGADKLYLATDPDREGEAISWHVRELLKNDNCLDGIDVKRVVFNEITRDAILGAFKEPRDLDYELVEAYLARRALDYLVGFTLSPVLWRKLPGSRSAGRVQSVALRLICERETAIENFIQQEYWSIKSEFETTEGKPFFAQLTHLEGSKLAKLHIGNEEVALNAVSVIEGKNFQVASVERKKTRRNPSPPFTTSTLQQEASRKLRFSARRTMQVAQKLYEGINIGGDTVGLITYMRTDGVQMANEAISVCRSLISENYGSEYVPESARVYKSKAKNAQEAHEAIRPTDPCRRPKDIKDYLDKDQLALYRLIWQRTVASQMESAVLNQVAVDIQSKDTLVQFHATGSVVAFDGFWRLYHEGRDDLVQADTEGNERILPPLEAGSDLVRGPITPEQHFTQPPPRYSEASLVKTLEELGIGRPSTYASIISVLQDRDYVVLENRRFTPEDRGRVVTAFLESFFTRYVAYDFTAELENKLDDISGGKVNWKDVLREFWDAFSIAIDGTKELRITHVLDQLDGILGPHFFRDLGDGKDPRNCPVCDGGRLNLKIGKFGAFIGCTNYPDCRYTRPLAVNDENTNAAGGGGPKELGCDPTTGEMVTLRQGPYGWYVQLGGPQSEDKKKPKPKRSSLPRALDPADVDLEKALGLLALPREIGTHPETSELITAAIGRFGPYIKMGATYVSLKDDDDILTVGLNRAVHLFADAPRKDPPKTLGPHPRDDKPVTQRTGRWGPYVKHGKLMATLPKDMDEDILTLEIAIKLLDEKAAKGSSKGPKTRGKGGVNQAPRKKSSSASIT
ncbi:MAG: DNA topoisomerase I [Rhodospirillaceae bacterium TMED8]|nr:DNA topoisomerase I [Magnetovibrio sp.]OUT49058.1 MAG: DNA topoisomerase I [Rhodospirillaceae bacterium TMED8]